MSKNELLNVQGGYSFGIVSLTANIIRLVLSLFRR